MPLIIKACREGNVELLKKLIKYNNSKFKKFLFGNYCNYRYKTNKTALMCASLFGHDSCVRVLLEAGADPNIRDNKGFTALLWASWLGHDSCTKALIEAGADPNIKNNYGETALITASSNGHENCVKILLEAGADPNIGLTVKTNEGLTALVFASWYGHYSCFKILIKAGADINIIEKLFVKKDICIIKRINIMYFLKEYYENFKTFNNNLIRELSFFL